MNVTLFIAALVSFAGFVFLIRVGWVVAARRASSPRTQRAVAAFAGWWYALAATCSVTALVNLLVATADPPLSLVLGLQFLNLSAACMGLAALLYYLLYFYTGRTFWFWPLTIVYAVAAALLIRMVGAWQPVEFVATPWSVQISYASAASGFAVIVMGLLLIGPQLLASLAVLVLALRLPPSAERVRLLVVGGAIAMWFGSSLLASMLGLTDDVVWQAIQIWVPIVLGISVLLVHRPPHWLARHLPPDLSSGSPDSPLQRSA